MFINLSYNNQGLFSIFSQQDIYADYGNYDNCTFAE